MKNLLSALLMTASLFIGTNVSAQEANIQKISDNVYTIFHGYYHSLIVIGDKGVLITDPANSWRANEIKLQVAKLTDLPVSKIVLSHEHYDHVGGTEVFPSAEIYAHSATESVLRLDVTGNVPDEVDHYVGDASSINVGGTKVDLLHFGAADGVGTLAVHLPKEKVVYTADIYETNAITDRRWIEDTNYLGTRELLNALVELKPEYAITAHSPELDPAQLNLAANFTNDLYDAVSAPLTEAMSKGFGETMKAVDALPNEIKLPKYENLGNYDHLPTHVHRMVMSIFHGG